MVPSAAFRSLLVRLVVGALAVLAVGGAVDAALPDGEAGWVQRAFSDAGEGLEGCGTCDGPGR